MKPATVSFIVFVYFSAISARAQGIDVRGVAVDSVSGERLPFVNVTIIGEHRGAATNARGFYIITNVTPGSYEAMASAVGYGHRVQRVVLRGTEPVTVNFELVPEPVQVSEVLVEAARPREASEANPSVLVLTQHELQRIPAPGQADVLRSLQILPGIVSTADISSKFYVRGGAGDQNLILLDGMRIYHPFHAFGIFSIFDPDIVSTSEIFTGGFPAGYGGRLSSVLSVNTRTGNRTRVSAKGSIDFLSAKLRLEGPAWGDNSWIVSGRQSLHDDVYKKFLKQPAPVSFYDLFFKGTSGLATIGRESVQGFISGDDITSDRIDEPDYSWRNQAFAFSLSGLIDDRIYLNAVAFESRFNNKRDAKQSRIVFPAEATVEEIGLRADLTIYRELGDVVFGGFELNVPQIESKFMTSQSLERAFSKTTVEYWMWGRYLVKFGRMTADLGIHSDVVSLVNHGPGVQAFQPRLSASYEFIENWRAKASFGVYNQNLISINNEDDVVSLYEAWVPVPDNLKPEEALQYIVGVEGNILPELSAQAQGYLKTYTSLALYNRDKVFGSDPDYIGGTGRAYGAELLLRLGTPMLDLFLAYTLGWTPVDANGFSYSPRYDRRHTVNALASLRPLTNVEATVRWEFGSGYPFTKTVGYYERLSLGNLGIGPFVGESGAPYTLLGNRNASRLPTYHRLDASVTCRFSIAFVRGVFGVHLVNLYGRKNLLFFDRKTGQRIDMLSFYPSATLSVEL